MQSIAARATSFVLSPQWSPDLLAPLSATLGKDALPQPASHVPSFSAGVAPTFTAPLTGKRLAIANTRDSVGEDCTASVCNFLLLWIENFAVSYVNNFQILEDTTAADECEQKTTLTASLTESRPAPLDSVRMSTVCFAAYLQLQRKDYIFK